MACWNVIDLTELGASASSYNPTSIPSSYDHLYLIASVRTDDSGTYYDLGNLEFNGDTGSNYSYQTFYVHTNSAFNAASSASETTVGYLMFNGPSTLADTFGIFEMWIPNYTKDDAWRQVLIQSSVPNNDGTDTRWALSSVCGLWKNASAAIDEIKLQPNSTDQFVQYSSFTLYGINGAG